MNIISKFAVGSDESIDQLFSLREYQLKDTYENLLESQELKNYIKEQLDHKTTINELNDLSTQLIMTFVENKPVGYIILKNSYYQPKVLADKKAIQIISFFILSEYDNIETRQSLWQKCFSVTRSYNHWIELPKNDPSISFLAKCEFKIIEQCEMKPFNIPSHVMVRSSVQH
jgi:predicted acetyltransferase